jgi:hypothetical protein
MNATTKTGESIGLNSSKITNHQLKIITNKNW